MSGGDQATPDVESFRRTLALFDALFSRIILTRPDVSPADLGALRENRRIMGEALLLAERTADCTERRATIFVGGLVAQRAMEIFERCNGGAGAGGIA